MNPLSVIEKWIMEHGSASILRDHVALLKEKMADLETENRALKAENAMLKSERDTTQAEAQQLKVQIAKHNRRKRYVSGPDGKLRESTSEQAVGGDA